MNEEVDSSPGRRDESLVDQNRALNGDPTPFIYSSRIAGSPCCDPISRLINVVFVVICGGFVRTIDSFIRLFQTVDLT